MGVTVATSEAEASERPQISYKTELGDPFHIASIAGALGVHEKFVAYAMSMGLTLIVNAAAVAVCVPVRVLTESTWGLRGPGVVSSGSPLFLQNVWDFLSTNAVNVTGSAVFPFMSPLIWYYLSILPGTVLDLCDFQWSRQYKIQAGAVPSLQSMLKSLRSQLINIVVFAGPGLTMMWMNQGPWPYYGPSSLCLQDCSPAALFPTSAPSVFEVLFHIAFSLVIFDFAFGVWHILHHKSRPLYRHVHSYHHTFFMTFSLVTQYVDLIELLVVSLLSMLLPYAMGQHPLTNWLWAIISVQLSVESHAGYDFPFLMGRWLLGGPLLGLSGPVGHDRHHQRPRTNMFPYLKWGDMLFGTSWPGHDAVAAGVKSK